MVELIDTLTSPILVILVVSVPIYYLWVQRKSHKFHFHWVGVLTLYWSLPTIGSVWLALNGVYNVFFLLVLTNIHYVWIAWFILPVSGLKRILLSALVVLPLFASLFLNLELRWDWYGVDYGGMISPALVCLYSIWRIFHILMKADREDLLQSSDYWVSSAILFYFVFLLINEVIRPLWLLDMNYYSIGLLSLWIANLMAAIFFIRGIQLWSRSISF